MPAHPPPPSEFIAALHNAIAAANNIIFGKEQTIRLAFTCLIARGHLLIEDFPGVGKTTLAHALARILGLDYQRIQFTSDLLPADIIGVSVYDTPQGRFEFHPGPIFSALILADEINRATPKTQSALLEAMEERQVTAEGKTRSLPDPFFVIATQNPAQQIGAFPLPESQLDRFLMRIEIGYPDRDAERRLLAGSDPRSQIASLPSLLPAPALRDLQAHLPNLAVSDALLDYVQAIITYTRSSPHWSVGLSPRAAQALIMAARAWAMIDGRTYVLPEDVQAVLPAVAVHRLHPAQDSAQRLSHADISALLIEAVPIP